MSKKVKGIIIFFIVALIVVGGALFTYNSLKTKKIEATIEVMRKEEKDFQGKVNKLLLGNKDKEWEELIEGYTKSLENKDLNKAEDFKIKINDFITNLEIVNLEELQGMLESFKKLDISKLDDKAKEDINENISLINTLKEQKDFKEAFVALKEIEAKTNKLIEEKTKEEEEKRKEEERKQAEEKKKQEEEERAKNSKNESENSGTSRISDNATKSEETSNSSGNSSNSPYENGSVESYIARSQTAQYTNQIIATVASGSSAQVYLLEKNNGVWEKVLQTSGFVGSGGVGQASEYVSKTPKGSYSLGFAFGTGGNPGSILPYRQITNNSYWICDVNSPYYNTWQEGDFEGNGNEHLIDYATQYRYAITLNYNNGVGGGSAIFLHCSNGSPTAGCVSVPTNIMLNLMQRIHSGAHIINVNSLSELANY